MFYYTFTTFDCNFIPRNAEICKVSSETKNVGKAHKYRLNRHLPTYEKIIKNLYSFWGKNIEKRWDEVILTKQCKEGRRKSFVKWEQCRKKPLRQQVVIPETAERFL